MRVLAEILERKRAELPEIRALSLPAPPPRRPFDLRRSAGSGLGLIAEIKRRSPSAGPLSTELGVADRARVYASSGADAISVLTDAQYFDGAWSHLGEARAAQSLPLLCKDFVIDEAQLDAARAFGADAVLLIVRCLEPTRLPTLLAAAAERELDALVEVATEEEADRALEAGATLVGVNARDLDTLAMDPARAGRVLDRLGTGVVRVHLSGLAAAADVERVAKSGVDAALIGEALMRQADPSALLATLRRAAGPKLATKPSAG
jgi:indole-3-glycerol phosphate synthase